MKILAPTNCPSCDNTLERVNARLFCYNTECPAQSSKRLQNFCKKLKIKGFGEATLDKLGLTGFNDLIDLLTVEYAESKGLSNLMANKLVNVINDRLSSGLTANDFLAACSIPLIGDGAMRKLKFDSISNLTYNMCIDQGIGNKAATNLIDWIEEEWPLYEKTWSKHLITKEFVPTTVNSDLPVVCITGGLQNFTNRKAATEHLESLGFTVKGSVTKAVQYLISEDSKESSSLKKAIGYGISLTTIKDLEEKYVKN